MGRKSRKYNKDIEILDVHEITEEEHVVDNDWEKEMKDDEMTWSAIILYEQLEDDHYWFDTGIKKPNLTQFIQEYKVK